jgi:hypothetical protein
MIDLVKIGDKCPYCDVGVVRPTGPVYRDMPRSGKDRESRKGKCDNDDCGREFTTLIVVAPIGTVVDVDEEKE